MMEREITIAGKGLRLRYTVNALCDMEARAGGSLDGLLERTFSGTRLLLWGGLHGLQPELSPEGAGDLLSAHIASGGTLDEIVEACAEALETAGFFRPPMK